MREIIVITGPTCSGKTSRALQLAREIGAEIISCDSVQIYKGMDIGSAKATPQERAKVRHHLLDIKSPNETFDIAEYVELAKSAMEDIFGRGKKVIVTGGSGFYLKAWFGAVTDNIEIPDAVKLYADKIGESGASALARELLKIDSAAADFVDMNNPRRTKNALMRSLASGLSVGQLREKFASMQSPMGEFRKTVEYLNPPDEIIFEKISERTHAMYEDGLIGEVENLLSKYGKLSSSAACAIGYREVIQYLKNPDGDIGALLAEIEKNTRALVKKQRKFFKGQLGLV